MKVIISHKADLDGIASAAIFGRWMLQGGEAFTIYLKDYEDEADIIESSLLKENDLGIYVSDVSPNEPWSSKIVDRVGKLIKNGNSLTWLDHHPAGSELRASLIAAGANINIVESAPAAAVLVYDEVKKKDDISRVLREYAIQSDTAKVIDKEVQDMSDLIAYYNYLDSENKSRPHLRGYALYLMSVDEGSKCLLGEEERNSLEFYRKRTQEAFDLVRRTLTLTNVNGTKLAFALAPRLISGSAAAQYAMKNSDSDILIIIKEDGALSFRRTRDTIDLSKIAVMFGGGGHPYASGGRLPYSVDVDSFKNVVNMMSARISTEKWRSD